MGKRGWVIGVVVALSCSSDGSHVGNTIDAPVIDGPTVDARVTDGPTVDATVRFDAVPDVPAQSSCEQARAAWQTRMAMVDHTCSVPADCGLIGMESPISCEAPPFVASRCEGEAARETAIDAARTELDQLEATWRACGPTGGTFDCGPGLADCVEGHCVAKPMPCPNNCACPPEVDAGT